LTLDRRPRRLVNIDFEVENCRRLPDPAAAVALHGLLLAADAVGCVRRTLDRTVAYAGDRQAFGRPIGGFQAVQHRLVDHAIRARGMALLVSEAARLLTAGAPDARRFVAMAEVSVSSGATHNLLQLTGAIGFTWEHGLHLCERRVHQDARLAANPRAAARSLAGLEGWTALVHAESVGRAGRLEPAGGRPAVGPGRPAVAPPAVELPRA
jgi:alkylation response protein AidB-like acyl-CoA dehydrogenase